MGRVGCVYEGHCEVGGTGIDAMRYKGCWARRTFLNGLGGILGRY